MESIDIPKTKRKKSQVKMTPRSNSFAGSFDRKRSNSFTNILRNSSTKVYKLSEKDEKKEKKEKNIHRINTKKAYNLSSPTLEKKTKHTKRKRLKFLRRNSAITVSASSHISNSPLIKKGQYDISKIILLQSVFRSWRIQNHFLNKKQTNQIQIQKTLYKQLNELISNEKYYVTILHSIIKSYIKPLSNTKLKLQIPTPDLSKELLYKLFFNIETLYSFHKESLYKFEQMINDWPFCIIGYPIHTHMKQLTLLYNSYVSNLRSSEKIIKKYIDKPLYKLFLHSKSKEHSSTGITSLKELLWYPTKYLITINSHIKDIFFTLSPFHTCHVYMDIFFATSISICLEQSLKRDIYKEDFNNAKSIISKSLEDSSFISEYSDFDKRFIKDGISTFNRKRLRLFLFSDILLITKIKGKTLKLLENVNLPDITITLREYAIGYDLVYYKIKTPNKLYPIVEKRTSGFGDVLAEQILLARASLASINDATAHKPGISPLIMKCLYYLDKSPSALKFNMFRNTKKTKIPSLNLIIEELKGKHSDFNKCHRDELVILLTEYISCLPSEFLIPSSIFSNIDFSLKQYTNIDIISNSLASNIFSLSTTQQNWLDYFTYFLERLWKDGINSCELSIYFSFLFIKDKSDNILSSCKQITNIIQVFKFLIEHHSSIFEIIHEKSKTNTYPKNADEFISANTFGEWWKSFRALDKSFLKEITSKSFFIEYFNILSTNKEEENGSNCTIVSNILQTPAVAYKLIEDSSIFEIYFNKLLSSKEQTLKYYVNIFLVLIDLDSKYILDFMLSIQPMATDRLLCNIQSGNIQRLFINIIKKSIDNHSLHELIIFWLSKLLPILIEGVSDDSYEYYNFYCISILVCNIFAEGCFQYGPQKEEYEKIIELYAKDIVINALVNNNSKSTELFNIIHCFMMSVYDSKLISKNDESLQLLCDEKEETISIEPVLDNSNDNIPSDDILSDLENVLFSPRDNSKIETHNSLLTSSNTPALLYRAKSLQENPLKYIEDKSIIKNSFIQVLFNNTLNIENILLDKDENGNLSPVLGLHRFTLIKTLCYIIQLNIISIAPQIISSNWIETIFILVFKYENNSILQQIIYAMLDSIVTRGDSTLLELLLIKTSFMDSIIQFTKQSKKSIPIYIKVICSTLLKNGTTIEYLQDTKQLKTIQKIIK